jgi:dienelactone hydrolase
MKSRYTAVFAFIFIMMSPLSGFKQENSGPEDDLIVKARAFLEALSKGDFEEAAKDFDTTMMKVSGPDKLAEFWKQVPERMGAFKRQTTARRDRLGEYEVAMVTCEFEKVTLDARVVFDKEKKIAGFQFVPSLPPAKYEPPPYANPTKFEECEVKIGEGGDWPLPGTLAVPKGAGPFPALVLVHGSGPNDRDETLGPNKPFQDIAWGLASRGIAVLRYEKRTRLYGPKLVADPKFIAALTVKEETIDDAIEAVRLLKNTPGIDPKKIFVLGHSLGGMLIPRIALAGKDLDIAGFIVMAGLTKPLPETFLRQMTYLLSLDGETSADDKKQLDEIKSDVARINALQASDAGKSDRIINAPPAYWLDLRGYYPPDVALKIDRPMLILQGSRDYQVTTEDFENWKKALGGRADVELKLYPKLNHLFAEGQGIPTPNEYSLVHGSVAEYVISDIAGFIFKY